QDGARWLSQRVMIDFIATAIEQQDRATLDRIAKALCKTVPADKPGPKARFSDEELRNKWDDLSEQLSEFYKQWHRQYDAWHWVSSERPGLANRLTNAGMNAVTFKSEWKVADI